MITGPVVTILAEHLDAKVEQKELNKNKVSYSRK
jgi:hypothetical protein